MVFCLLIGFGCSMMLGVGKEMKENVEMAKIQHFSDASEAIAYLFAIATGNYAIDFHMFSTQMVIFYVAFIIFSNMLVFTLLSAICTSTTYLQGRDIEGLTFLERGKDIVELESMCSTDKRVRIWDSMNFEMRIEFDEGDLGLNYGIQILEPANRRLRNATTEDRIYRFPGEASSKLPWPVDQGAAKNLDEKLVQLETTFLRIAKMIRELVKLHDRKGAGNKAHTMGTSSNDQDRSAQEESSAAAVSKDSEE